MPRVGKQCSIISKLRHYVPRKQFLRHYDSNVKSIIQYGILVYGCCGFSSLSAVLALQKKILMFFFFRKRCDSSTDLFVNNRILIVYELHLYELLKFVLPSLWGLHSESYLNEMFVFEKPNIIRRSNTGFVKVPSYRKKVERNFVKCRAIKLYNHLIDSGVFSSDIRSYNASNIINFYHKLKNSFLVDNPALVQLSFAPKIPMGKLPPLAACYTSIQMRLAFW